MYHISNINGIKGSVIIFNFLFTEMVSEIEVYNYANVCLLKLLTILEWNPRETIVKSGERFVILFVIITLHHDNAKQHFVNCDMLSRARQEDLNVCSWQENWQCERFACSWQKDTTDKTPLL